MELIDGFDQRALFQGRKRIGLGAFARTIVDDGHARMNRAHHRWIVAGIDPMMIDLKNIHRTDQVLRTHQTVLDVPGQIAAIKEFEAVYSIQPASDPEHRRLLLLLSECYLRRGEDAKVVALLDPLADADPNDLALAYLLGTALLHQGQDQRGALMIERILRNGDTAEAHMLMAFTRMKANDKKGAKEEVDRAITLNPNLPEAYSLRGRLAYVAADLDGAEAAFRKALQLDPTAFDTLLWLGTLLREESKLREARSRLEQAIQLRPKEIRVRYQFALLCSDEGDDKRAAELLKALTSDAPEYTEAHRSLSTIYFRLGRVAEGRQERKIAEEMDAAIQAREQERGRKLRKCDQ